MSNQNMGEDLAKTEELLLFVLILIEIAQHLSIVGHTEPRLLLS